MISPLTPDEFRTLTGVSRETLERLRAYDAILQRWTRRINLVGAGTLADVWRRHMLDSAQLLDLLPPAGARRDGRERCLVDLGSGAGFPGLVLAILGAGAVHLVESDQRKAAFLREAARQTETQVMIHATRAESLPALPADVVTARAFAPLIRLLDTAAPIFRAAETQGIAPLGLFLKGQRVEEELAAARKKWRLKVKKVPSRSHASAIVLAINPQGLVGTDL